MGNKNDCKGVRTAAMVISIVIGMQLVASFCYIFGIKTECIPAIAILVCWFAFTVLVGCVVDEILKKVYNTRLIMISNK